MQIADEAAGVKNVIVALFDERQAWSMSARSRSDAKRTEDNVLADSRVLQPGRLRAVGALQLQPLASLIRPHRLVALGAEDGHGERRRSRRVGRADEQVGLAEQSQQS